jgi:hypothetical protein
LLNHDRSSKLDHPEYHEDKYRRNESEFDGSRALSFSSAQSATLL